MPTKKKWFYRLGATEFGPYSAEMFEKLVRAHRVPRNALVSNDTREWTPFDQVADIDNWLTYPSSDSSKSQADRGDLSESGRTRTTDEKSPNDHSALPDWKKNESIQTPPTRRASTKPDTLSKGSTAAKSPLSSPFSQSRVLKGEGEDVESRVSGPRDSHAASVKTKKSATIYTVRSLPLMLHPHQIPGVVAWTATELYGKLHTGRRILWSLIFGLPFITLLVPTALTAQLGGIGMCFWPLVMLVALIWIPGLYLKAWRWTRIQHERKIARLARLHTSKMAERISDHLQACGLQFGGATFEILPDGAVLLVTRELLCWSNLEIGQLHTIHGDHVRNVRLEKVHASTITTETQEEVEWNVSMSGSTVGSLLEIVSGLVVIKSLFPDLTWKKKTTGGTTKKEDVFSHTVLLETVVPSFSGLHLRYHTDEADATRLFQLLQILKN